MPATVTGKTLLRMANGDELLGSVMTRFGVKNYKCLKEIDIPLTPIHVIIGQNDAGKTSLLQAMYALFRTATHELRNAFSGKWNGKDLVFEYAKTPVIDLNGTFQISRSSAKPVEKFEYGLSVEFSKDDDPICAGEWFIDGKDAERFDFGKTSRIWTQISQWKDGGDAPAKLRKCLHLVQSYQLDPKMMAISTTIDPIRKFRMDADGFGLANLLDDLLSFDPERFIDLRRRFCEYFPQFRSVRLESQDAVSRAYDTSGGYASGGGAGKGIFFETRSGKSIRAQQASEGAILFLGFLALTFLPVPPKLILIEEPEKGVYPKRLEEIVKLLRNVMADTPESSRPQIILSTHSPYLVSFFEPEEVTLMSRDADNGIVAHPMRDIPHIKERLGGGEFYLGELWYNLSEEELFGGAPYKLLEIFGEGKTDIGKATSPELPDSGVITILVHTLCGRPDAMRVKRKALPFLQGKRLWQKVKFAKRQAVSFGSDAVVFVLDTEGDHKQRMKDLEKGRDAKFPTFPMAVGAAHPCIEAWLLADAKAIKKAVNLSSSPQLPDAPESLPAPQHDRKHNPKTVLAKCAEVNTSELSSAEKDKIATEIKDAALICAACPLGFGAFALEVEQRIKPIFDSPAKGCAYSS